MDDLISRAAAIEAAIDGADYWDGGYNPERERCIREHMAKVPSVDTVPVKWLKEHCYKDIGTSDGCTYGRRRITVLETLSIWQKEQEAR